MQRLNKEYKLDLSNSINIVCGTVDRFNPYVIYITAKTWLKAKENGLCDDIDIILASLKKNIRNEIKTRNVFSDKYIFDFDLNVEGLNHSKPSFLTFELFLKQKQTPPTDLKQLRGLIVGFYKPIIKDFEHNLKMNNFIISKTKRME